MLVFPILRANSHEKITPIYFLGMVPQAENYLQHLVVTLLRKVDSDAGKGPGGLYTEFLINISKPVKFKLI